MRVPFDLFIASHLRRHRDFAVRFRRAACVGVRESIKQLNLGFAARLGVVIGVGWNKARDAVFQIEFADDE